MDVTKGEVQAIVPISTLRRRFVRCLTEVREAGVSLASVRSEGQQQYRCT